MRKLATTLPPLFLALFLAAPGFAASIQLVRVLSGLTNPVFVTHAGDGTNRLFILEQAGIIKVLQSGAATPTVFLDIRSKILSGGERGLLGLAFHPQYPANPRFYVNYTRAGDGAIVVAEYQVSADPNVAGSAEVVLLVIPHGAYSNHNGGMIAFGADGFLYIATGDGGGSFDPDSRAQNKSDLLGKILRIDVDHTNGPVQYSSPATNPFFGPAAGADEVYAYGMRNPWRFSFDRVTNELYVGDVGQDVREEIDIVTLGGNYGWRVWEGTRCTGLTPDTACTGTGYTAPVIEYEQLLGRCSVTGGYVYRGTAGSLPVGSYVFGDYCTGEIFLVEAGSMSVLSDTTLRISSFGEDEAGEVYVVGLVSGTIDRITNAAPPPPPPPPPPCTYSISPATANFGVPGGTGTVSVTAPAGCTWTAVPNDSWITVTSGASGSGNGIVGYSVATYTLKKKFRTGTITIAGKTFTVKQSR